MKSDEETKKDNMKRVKANDPVALREMGIKCYNEGDYGEAFKYYTKAAELGDMDGHYSLSVMYREGEAVEKNEKKEVHHLEEAAIGGHPEARYNLGMHEYTKNRRIDRSIKHFIIAAKLGLDKALERVKEGFLHEAVSKDDYAAALRGHQAAVDATKSEQREEAYAASPGLLGN
jgi:TPR repeat protein